MSIALGLVVGLGIVGARAVLKGTSRAIDRRIARGRIPSLYPSLSDAQLCEVFGAEESSRLCDNPRVVVTPFGGSDARAQSAGRAVAALLRRDLSLVRGLSTAGYEDSPSAPLDAPETAHHLVRNGCVVGGTTHFEGSSLRVELWATHRDRIALRESFRAETPQVLRKPMLEALAVALGGAPSEHAHKALETGHPQTHEQLVRVGQVLTLASERRAEGIDHDGDLEVEARALELLAEAPSLSVLAPCLSDDRLGDLLRLYENDPFDAALCFRLYCVLWRDVGFQRDAFQFVRRALTLCPSHGKANMVAPHAALRPEQMGHHSELACRVLPDNSFAVSNYALWLATYEKDHSKTAEVARAGIDLAPQNPANYERLIDAYEALGDIERALEVAGELTGWFEPEIHPRTRYCLYQNPSLRERMEKGLYDPAQALRQRIAQLEKKRAVS